jgi:hypothetical protein
MVCLILISNGYIDCLQYSNTFFTLNCGIIEFMILYFVSQKADLIALLSRLRSLKQHITLSGNIIMVGMAGLEPATADL